MALSQWNNGSVKGSNEEARTLREYLRQVEAKLFEHYRNLLANDDLVTPDALKNAYLGLETQQHSLLELMDYHNKHLKDTLEWGTLKNYFTTQNYVKLFLSEKLRKKDIYLSQLSYQFITELEMLKPTGRKITVNRW